MNREQLRQYTVAVVITLFVFAAFSFYLWLRRGYFTLYVANKAAADSSLFLLGVVLLIGPLSRLYQRFDSWIKYRKELGIVAFFLAAAHGIISFFFLPAKFPLSFYLQENLVSFIFALSSTIVLLVLFVTSFKKVIARMNHTRWWQLQSWGVRLAIVLAFAHMTAREYDDWLRWLARGGSAKIALPYLPPQHLPLVVFGLFVLLVRLAELLGAKVARVITAIAFIVFLATLLGLVVWGKLKTPRPLPLSWKVCVELPGSKILEASPPICIAPDGRRATSP